MKIKPIFPQKKIEAFCRMNHVKKLSVFGSTIHGDAGPDSDVDVLVEFEEGHTPGFAFFDMEAQLSQILGKKVDLNTPAFLSRYFRDDVVREAQVQYGK
jgi:predicted nucleotidyltransferase